MARVFISYARKDAVDLAIRLRLDLESHGYSVWLDRARMEGGASWTVEIERAIDRCDAAVALLSPGSFESDICRAEQLRALRRGKRVIPVMAVAGCDVPLHLESKHYIGADEVVAAIRSGGHGIVLAARFRSTYVTVPPLPRTYIARPEALADLRDAVIADEPGASIALTAVRGMGGIGKTILAQALGQDEVVQQAFPDGVVWVTVGKEASLGLTARMQEVRRALGDEPGVSETDLHCTNRYRTVLRAKAALVIVDDIWRVEDVEPFLAESRRSRLLFTTRDGGIAAAVGAVEHAADLLTLPQARMLLSRWAGCGEMGLPAEAGELIRECGFLPLAVSMVGAMLRGKTAAYWGHVLGLLRRVDLAKIRMQFPNYPHADLMRSVQVSVEALEAKARERYLALAVLLEDMPAAPEVQQTLWGVDEGDALETAELFVGLSLAQRDGDSGGIWLHDLQLDYARGEWGDRAALELIHGAVRLSAHVFEKDPGQFASQMVGRLFGCRELPSIGEFLGTIEAGARSPWLRPLRPALHLF